MLLPTFHNFGGGQKEIFKWVVVQNCTLDQRRKIDAELKILHESKMSPWVHASGLRGFVGLTTSRRKHKATRAKLNRAAVEITRLDQNEKEVDSLNFSKEHH